MASPNRTKWAKAKTDAAKQAEAIDKASKAKGKGQAMVVKQIKFDTGLGAALDKAYAAKLDYDKCMAPSAEALSLVGKHEAKVKKAQSARGADKLDDKIAAIYQTSLREIRASLNKQRKDADIKHDIDKPAPKKGAHKPLTLINFPEMHKNKNLDASHLKLLGIKKLVFIVKIDDQKTLEKLAKADSILLREQIWIDAYDIKHVYKSINEKMLDLLHKGKVGGEAQRPLQAHLNALADDVLVKAYRTIIDAKRLPKEIRNYRLVRAGKVTLQVGPGAAMILTGWTTGVLALVGAAAIAARLAKEIGQELTKTQTLLDDVTKELSTLQKRLSSDKSWKNLAKETAKATLDRTLLQLGIPKSVGKAQSKLATAGQNNRKTYEKWKSASVKLNEMLESQEDLTKQLKKIPEDDLKALDDAQRQLKVFATKIDAALKTITVGMASHVNLDKRHKALKEKVDILAAAKDCGAVVNTLAWLASLTINAALQVPLTEVINAATSFDTSMLQLTGAGGDLKKLLTKDTMKKIK